MTACMTRSAPILIKCGPKNWNMGLVQSCYDGQQELAILMIGNGATDFNSGLRAACQSGQKELAILMIEYGATDFNSGLRAACKNGYRELTELMLQWGAIDPYPITYTELTQFVIKHGALGWTCRCGHRMDTKIFQQVPKLYTHVGCLHVPQAKCCSPLCTMKL